MNNQGDLEFPAQDENSFASSDLANIWDVIKNGGGVGLPIDIEVVGTGVGNNQLLFDIPTATAGLPAGKKFLMKIISIQFDHTGPSPPLAPIGVGIDFLFTFFITPKNTNLLLGSISNTLDFEKTRVNYNPIIKNFINKRINFNSITYANLTGTIPDMIFITPVPVFSPFLIFIDPLQGTFNFPQNATLLFQAQEIAP